MDQDKGQKIRVHGDYVGGDEITTESDIVSGSGIVIGRGKKAPVAKQAVAPPAEGIRGIPVLTFEDLTAQVDESDLSPELKQGAHVHLESLRSEIERGEAGDVQIVRQALGDIGENTPELREPLWQWLEGTEHVSTPIRIVARRLLT
jgi:hypothetical protein